MRAQKPSRFFKYFWPVFFGLWAVLLTGVLASYIRSPGILQAWRLRNLEASRQARINQMQDELLRLQTEANKLEKDRTTQLREIRRVLGYAASDELIFDFTPPERLQGK